jgi:oxygen-independent coproporphyrinogen-3 oxidase
MCHFETDWKSDLDKHPIIAESVNRLKEMEADELVEINPTRLKVTEKGKPFVRNICMAFDLRLLRNKPKTQLFSMTI